MYEFHGEGNVEGFCVSQIKEIGIGILKFQGTSCDLLNKICANDFKIRLSVVLCTDYVVQ